MKIRGNTVGPLMPRTNWEQTDPKKADYLKGREILEQEIQNAKTVADDAKAAAREARTAASNAQTAVGRMENYAVQKAGDTMTGPLNVPAPTENAHAANKEYVDGLRSSVVIASLSADEWSGNSAPYTQTIAVAGVDKSLSCAPHVGLILADDIDTALQQIEAYGYISKGETDDGTITFTCLEDKPKVNIDLQIEVHGAGGSGSSGSSSGGGNNGDVSIVGIASVSQTTTSTEDGGINVITVLLTDGNRSTFQVRNGSTGGTGATGPQGPAGKTPVKGTDYWTEADQESIVQQVITALGTPVFGRVDEENNIILTGELVDGTYTMKFENEDGSLTEICTYKHGAVENPNLLTVAVNESGEPFVGTNGEIGYQTDYRLNSSAQAVAGTGFYLTGYLPVKKGYVISVANVYYSANSGNNTNHKIAFYDESFNLLSCICASASVSGMSAFNHNSGKTAVDGIVSNGKFVVNAESKNVLAQMTIEQEGVAYIRISAEKIDETSVIQRVIQ